MQPIRLIQQKLHIFSNFVIITRAMLRYNFTDRLMFFYDTASNF